MRHRARVDANHAEVVKALRAVGALVHDTSRVGGGFPDIVVKFRGRVFLLEVKDGSKSKSRRQPTEAERKFLLLWWGPDGSVSVVESAEGALRVVGALP